MSATLVFPTISILTDDDAKTLIESSSRSEVGVGFRGQPHGERWIGFDDSKVYFIAGGQEESRRLALEKAILERVAKNGCPVPQVLLDAPPLQIRTKISGATFVDGERLVFGRDDVPPDRYDSALAISRKGKTLARDIGKAIARFHKAFEGVESAFEAQGLKSFRFDCGGLRGSLSSQLTQEELAKFATVCERYEAASQNLVISHGDLNHHNFCVDSHTGHLNGIFDFGDCCFGARELDFKFMLSNGHRFTDICLQVYEEAAGHALDRRSVMDHHILAAAENFAYSLSNTRHGVERCRRWTHEALAKLT